MKLCLGSIQISLCCTEKEEVDIHIGRIVRSGTSGIVVVPFGSDDTLYELSVITQVQRPVFTLRTLAPEDSAVVAAGSANL